MRGRPGLRRGHPLRGGRVRRRLRRRGVPRRARVHDGAMRGGDEYHRRWWIGGRGLRRRRRRERRWRRLRRDGRDWLHDDGGRGRRRRRGLRERRQERVRVQRDRRSTARRRYGDLRAAARRGGPPAPLDEEADVKSAPRGRPVSHLTSVARPCLATQAASVFRSTGGILSAKAGMWPSRSFAAAPLRWTQIEPRSSPRVSVKASRWSAMTWSLRSAPSGTSARRATRIQRAPALPAASRDAPRKHAAGAAIAPA